ncbi:hypothetical protein FA95DRAFT_1567371 [Auriscalpium vulgare]|uniref:Uncharacterized protein n=1 Tax=Auriscalpium vulgare TaxID=40419 RepID=A0ACB8R6A9_9AGAM|nr:hypothetical protein FA95DRAFT_1567371 [Auriscalpium vulgare]
MHSIPVYIPLSDAARPSRSNLKAARGRSCDSPTRSPAPSAFPLQSPSGLPFPPPRILSIMRPIHAHRCPSPQAPTESTKHARACEHPCRDSVIHPRRLCRERITYAHDQASGMKSGVSDMPRVAARRAGAHCLCRCARGDPCSARQCLRCIMHQRFCFLGSWIREAKHCLLIMGVLLDIPGLSIGIDRNLLGFKLHGWGTADRATIRSVQASCTCTVFMSR